MVEIDPPTQDQRGARDASALNTETTTRLKISPLLVVQLACMLELRRVSGTFDFEKYDPHTAPVRLDSGKILS